MGKVYVDGIVDVAFKPEAEQSEIEKVLNNYTFQKVFDQEVFANSKDREDKVLNRLYRLKVPVGSEISTLQELQEKYASLIEYVERPPTRKLIK